MTKTNTLKQAPYRVRRRWDAEAKKAVPVGWELTEYAGYGEIEWRDNDPFFATLDLVDIERGRSAARFIWNNGSTGTQYPMFMSGMLDLAMNDVIELGEVTGWWIVVKRGANYGIERYEQ